MALSSIILNHHSIAIEPIIINHRSIAIERNGCYDLKSPTDTSRRVALVLIVSGGKSKAPAVSRVAAVQKQLNNPSTGHITRGQCSAPYAARSRCLALRPFLLGRSRALTTINGRPGSTADLANNTSILLCLEAFQEPSRGVDLLQPQVTSRLSGRLFKNVGEAKRPVLRTGIVL